MTDKLHMYGTIQLGLVGWAVYWWIIRRDEIPLLVAGFFLFCGAFRAVVLAKGWAQPVNLGLDIFSDMGAEAWSQALWLIVVGETTLLGSYGFSQNRVLPIRLRGFPVAERAFLMRVVILLFVTVFPLAILASGYVGTQASMGRSLAFEVSSYAILGPMALIGVAILVLCMWRFGLFTSWFQKACAGLMLVGIAWFTFGPTLRFLFLGWVLAGGVIWSATAQSGRRWLGFAMSAVVALSLFGLAGAMRDTESGGRVTKSALDRVLSAEDANMLDGFVLLRQVFPEMLPHSHGQEHLNILLRPIPRALWPEKPVGGYMNKLGIFDSGSTITIGISPTLFGSFYQEGGLPGIIVFSILYGWALGRLVVWTTSLGAFPSLVVRASLFAGLVPLMRAGDLAGVYAWLGMSFWPCVLVLFWLSQRAKQRVSARIRSSRKVSTNTGSISTNEGGNPIRKLRPVSRRALARRGRVADRPGN